MRFCYLLSFKWTLNLKVHYATVLAPTLAPRSLRINFNSESSVLQRTEKYKFIQILSNGKGKKLANVFMSISCRYSNYVSNRKAYGKLFQKLRIFWILMTSWHPWIRLILVDKRELACIASALPLGALHSSWQNPPLKCSFCVSKKQPEVWACKASAAILNIKIFAILWI